VVRDSIWGSIPEGKEAEMNLSRNLRLVLFGSLYLAQGAVMSFIVTFNILYLGDSGYGPADVGIFQAVLLIPFILKIFLGMLSDGVNLFGLGHRKPYILIGLVGTAAVVLAAPYIPIAEGLTLYAVVLFLGATSMALYDTCTDGLALDTTPENERGLVQGIMTGARSAGILILLTVGGWLVSSQGWSWYFVAIAVLTVLPIPLVLMVKEDPTQMQRQPFQWSAFRSLLQGAVILVGVLGILQTFTLDGVLTFLSDYLRQTFDISVGNVGMLVALSMVGRILGAATNSWLTDRIGHRQSLFVAIGLAFVACVGLALFGAVPLVALFGFVFGVAYGYYASVYAAVAMDFSDPHIAASMFAIFMMFVNIGTAAGQSIGGMLTERLGFTGMVLLMGFINLLNIPVVIGIFRGRSKKAPR
jgi:PAT family beta-lactamase induction signal transducer AmpG